MASSWFEQIAPLLEYIQDSGRDILEEIVAPAARAHEKAVRGLVPGTVLARRDAKRVLINLRSELEMELQRICGRHSRLYWLLLARSAPHEIFVEPDVDPAVGVTKTRLLTAAILKYGTMDTSDVIECRDGIGRFISDPEDILALLKLMTTAVAFSNACAAWSTFGRGASIWINEEGVLSRVPDNPDLELQEEIHYERRPRADRNLFARVGLVDNLEVGRISDVAGLYAVVAIPVRIGIEDKELTLNTDRGPVRIKSVKYHGQLHDLRPLHRYLALFRQAVERKYGLSPEEIIACLSALTWAQIQRWRESPRIWADMLQRGLTTATRQALIDYVAHPVSAAYELLTENKLNADPMILAERFLSAFALTHDNLAEIALQGGQPCHMLYDLGELFVMDWASGMDMLRTMILNTHLDDRMKDAKAEHFEADLYEGVLSSSANCPSLFEPRTKLKRNGRVIAEIDASFSKGSVAYMIDCKCYTITDDYLRGDERPVSNRWSYVQEWIHQSDRRANLVSVAPIGSNYALPSHITHIVPIVCSTWPEFIFSLEDRYYLTPQIPRVCTPDELIEFLTEVDEPSILRKPYAVAVVRK